MTKKKSSKVIRFDGLRLTVPPDWDDLTQELSPSGRPWTLASSAQDVGALQLSLAEVHSGKIPNPTAEELQSMLEEFSVREKLGKPIETKSSEGKLKVARASFRSAGDFVRVWYVSDGRSFALVTYVCTWKDRDIQLEVCQRIVESLEFCDSGSPGGL